MDSKEIGQLLEKYWNCETSLEEEQLLRSYFNGPDVPEQLKDAAELFRFFEGERRRTLSESFDSDMMRTVKKTERKAKVVSMVRWVQVARIAAGVLVVVVAGYFVRNEVMKTTPEDTFSDPRQALEETKKALMMISKSFGKAKEGVGKINMFNEAEDKITGKEKTSDSTEEDKTNI
ncbi:MAG TPA: hypothetical protein VFE50_05380 [Cyclobacteriaceae bacterium]|nr:hypothetical protein [Cyclobacteriaceae bacterium]